MLYLVAYRCEGDQPHPLEELLPSLSDNCWRAFDNVWVIESDQTAALLRDRIRMHLGEGEAAIVALLAGHAAWHGFEPRSQDWLLAHL